MNQKITRKRKSGGKGGSSKGRYKRVQCSKCGRSVPRAKAKVITGQTRLVDGRMYKELKKEGTIILGAQTRKFLCISCAVHSGVVSQRAKDERKTG
ncbi:MAG: 30S ribosomal protein S26 [Promethearchaeota archaeon]|nr:MAG: 30S ribosomal protein S26 [Candidatus Lokiarchaeota archaeon]